MSKMSNDDLEKIIELDIESELQPWPEDMSQIFEAVVTTDKVDEQTLREYLYSTRPSLKDISRALQMVAESQRNNISSDSFEKISQGLEILGPQVDLGLPDEELQNVYDRLIELLKKTQENGEIDIDKVILHSIFILVGTIVASITIPHLIKKRDEYGDQVGKAIDWLKDIFQKETD